MHGRWLLIGYCWKLPSSSIIGTRADSCIAGGSPSYIHQNSIFILSYIYNHSDTFDPITKKYHSKTYDYVYDEAADDLNTESLIW